MDICVLAATAEKIDQEATLCAYKVPAQSSYRSPCFSAASIQRPIFHETCRKRDMYQQNARDSVLQGPHGARLLGSFAF